MYILENNLEIGNWTVNKNIKLCGPKGTSIYKYDFRVYMEFVITDQNGEARILDWNHNAGDKALHAYTGNSAMDALPLFFSKHPIFDAEDWDDYTNVMAIKDIEEVIEKESWSATQKVAEIKKIVCG